jgi:hypothetical protein
MGKRALLIGASILVAAFLVYIGVASANGSYGTAIGIGGADMTAAREGNAVVTKIRMVPGVASATFAFTSGLIANRKSEITVQLASTAPLTSVRRVVDIARAEYGHGVGTSAGAVEELAVSAAPALDVSDFSMTDAQTRRDLGAWEALRRATGTAVTVQLADSGHKNLAFASRRGATYPWIAAHYSLLKSLSREGFTWTSDGVCDVGSLPDEAVIAVVARISKIVPVVSCNSSGDESGLQVSTGNGMSVSPAVQLGFTNGHVLEPFSVHAHQFAEVSTILLGSGVSTMNIGFFGSTHGKLTVLRFFTGTCTTGLVTHPDKVDAASLADLKSRGVDVVKRATLGQCTPRSAVASASPTPAG